MQFTRYALLAALVFAALTTPHNLLSADSPRFLFGPPTRLPDAINDADEADLSPSMTADGLNLVFSSWRGGPSTIYESTRLTTSQPFTTVHEMPGINNENYRGVPFISGDGRELYFQSTGQPGPDFIPDQVDV